MGLESCVLTASGNKIQITKQTEGEVYCVIFLSSKAHLL